MIKISYLCVLIAAILPYVFVGFAKFSSKGYNNNSPRDYLEKIDGQAKRAHWAHLNSFEAFPAFAAGVIIAQLAGVDPSSIALLSILFVTFRIAYGACYILDKANIRSLVWFAAFICVISLYVASFIK